KVRIVPSRYTIIVTNNKKRIKILKKSKEIEVLTSGKIEENKQWFSYVLGKTPTIITIYTNDEWDYIASNGIIPSLTHKNIGLQELIQETEEIIGMQSIRMAWGKQ